MSVNPCIVLGKSESFQTWLFIRGMELGKYFKISSQYLLNYTCTKEDCDMECEYTIKLEKVF